MQFIWYNEYLVSTVGTDGLVLLHQASLATVLRTHPRIASCLRVNSLGNRRSGCDFKCAIIKYILQIDILQDFGDESTVHAFDNVLVPSGTKPLSDPMLTCFLSCHKELLGINDLTSMDAHDKQHCQRHFTKVTVFYRNFKQMITTESAGH